MARRSWSRRMSWLRHWRGFLQLGVRLGILVGLCYGAVQLYNWIGPEEVAVMRNDPEADFSEGRRVALANAARVLKIGMLLLGCVALLVLWVVYLSRTPIAWQKAERTPRGNGREDRVGGSGSGASEGKQSEERRKTNREDSDSGSHSIVYVIDPDTLEDRQAR